MKSPTSRTRTLGASAAVLGLFLADPAGAQLESVPPTWGGPLLDRPRLTGDWGGFRDEMGKSGVTLDVDLTQVGQRVAGGGREEAGKYSGLFEYTLNLNSQKMGLWPGGFLTVQGMTNYGTNVGYASGAIIPANITALFPEPGQTSTGLMNASFTQFLSQNFGVAIGKLSALGGDANAFAHDYHSQFLNAGLNFNMALDLFPFTSYGAAMVYVPWDKATLSFSVIDPQGSAENNNLTNLFQNGVVLGTEGRTEVKIGNLVGHQLMGFVWSNATRLALEQSPLNTLKLIREGHFPWLNDLAPIIDYLDKYFPDIEPARPPNKENSTWTFYYNFDQYLWSPPGSSDKGIGIFGRFGAADDKTSPVKYAFNLGLSGKGIVPGRPSDQFGIGWSRVKISGNLMPFLRKEIDIGLDHEDTLEMYYNAAITPAVGLAFDFQITNPATKKFVNPSNLRLENMDTAYILGLRLYMRF